MTEFTNPERTRYYGLRPGDIVIARGLDGDCAFTGVVERLAGGDNNRVYLRNLRTGKVEDWVAEWCDIIIKAEDREREVVVQMRFDREMVFALFQMLEKELTDEIWEKLTAAPIDLDLEGKAQIFGDNVVQLKYGILQVGIACAGIE